jgi:hypothetical protein
LWHLSNCFIVFPKMIKQFFSSYCLNKRVKEFFYLQKDSFTVE